MFPLEVQQQQHCAMMLSYYNYVFFFFLRIKSLRSGPHITAASQLIQVLLGTLSRISLKLAVECVCEQSFSTWAS